MRQAAAWARRAGSSLFASASFIRPRTVSKSAVLSGLTNSRIRPASLENVQGLGAGVASRAGSGRRGEAGGSGGCAYAADATETTMAAANTATATRPARRAGTAGDNPTLL